MNSTLFFPTALSQGAITKITAKLIIFPFIPYFCFEIVVIKIFDFKSSSSPIVN